jgi:hypothetical protein
VVASRQSSLLSSAQAKTSDIVLVCFLTAQRTVDHYDSTYTPESCIGTDLGFVQIVV